MEGRIAWCDHRPAVDEDLGPTWVRATTWLLSAIEPPPRRWNTLLQPEIGGVFGRIAHAPPPEHGPLFDEVVEPSLPDLGWRVGPTCVAVVGERADEGEGPRYVIVGNNQGFVELLVDVVGDVTEDPR